MMERKKKSLFLDHWFWFLRNTISPVRNPVTILIPDICVFHRKWLKWLEKSNFVNAEQLTYEAEVRREHC